MCFAEPRQEALYHNEDDDDWIDVMGVSLVFVSVVMEGSFLFHYFDVILFLF